MQHLLVKKRLFLGLSGLVLVGTVPFVTNQPVIAQLQEVREAIVEAILRPEVKLTLSAEKQVVELNDKGEETIIWEALEGKVAVEPGEVLRYIVDGENSSEIEAKGLSVTQPVPSQTTYILNSAKTDGNAEIVYSIDGGQSFVAEPMIEVLSDDKVELKAAPPEMYTHIQWNFGDALISAQSIKAFYDVEVK